MLHVRYDSVAMSMFMEISYTRLFSLGELDIPKLEDILPNIFLKFENPCNTGP